MEETKIQLSEDELMLMQNSDWILTKNSVIEKISHGLGALSNQMQQHFSANKNSYDSRLLETSPKVSKGEKYEGLPYVILDYPRSFGRKDVVAIRTLFWWGNYFSVTLHAKGIWQEIVTKNLLSDHRNPLPESFYMSLTGDEWSHDVKGEHYETIGLMRQKQNPGTIHSDFLKIAATVEIGAWRTVENKLFDLFVRFADLIKS